MHLEQKHCKRDPSSAACREPNLVVVDIIIIVVVMTMIMIIMIIIMTMVKTTVIVFEKYEDVKNSPDICGGCGR